MYTLYEMCGGMSRWDNADNRLILVSFLYYTFTDGIHMIAMQNDSEYQLIFVLCLMTNRLNPRLARAKLNVDSFILPLASHRPTMWMRSQAATSISRCKKQCSRVAPSAVVVGA